jgi:hypothetical protein
LTGVEDSTTGATHFSIRQSPDHFVVLHSQTDDSIDLDMELLEEFVESFSLGDRPGKTIQDESIFRGAHGHYFPNQTDHDIVGDEHSGIEESFGLHAKRAFFRDRLPQQITG